ncbi:MAG: helix-turn-helix domain-containing protein [Planctomycetota bacterium]
MDYDTVYRANLRIESSRERVARQLRSWVDEHGDLIASVIGATNPSLLNEMYLHYGPVQKTAQLLKLPWAGLGRGLAAAWYHMTGEHLAVTPELKRRFGRRFKEARKRAGLNQTSLAERLQLSMTTISSWERGLAMPQAINSIERIERVLKVKVRDLIA